MSCCVQYVDLGVGWQGQVLQYDVVGVVLEFYLFGMDYGDWYLVDWVFYVDQVDIVVCLVVGLLYSVFVGQYIGVELLWCVYVQCDQGLCDCMVDLVIVDQVVQ